METSRVTYVVFDKKIWENDRIQEWLESHGYAGERGQVMGDSIRFAQLPYEFGHIYEQKDDPDTIGLSYVIESDKYADIAEKCDWWKSINNKKIVSPNIYNNNNNECIKISSM